jgi:hypothetical protein
LSSAWHETCFQIDEDGLESLTSKSDRYGAGRSKFVDENHEEPLDAAQGCLSTIKYGCLLNAVIVLLLGIMIAGVLSAVPPITMVLAGVK